MPESVTPEIANSRGVSTEERFDSPLLRGWSGREVEGAHEVGGVGIARASGATPQRHSMKRSSDTVRTASNRRTSAVPTAR